MRRMALGLLLCLSALYTAAAVAAATLDGHYRGTVNEQEVSAVLETVSTTVTGMMTIGQTRYLIKAEKRDGAFSGELSNMLDGSSAALQFKPSAGGLGVAITPKNSEAMRFSLQRSD